MSRLHVTIARQCCCYRRGLHVDTIARGLAQITRNAWQNLACSPPGLTMFPQANGSETNPTITDRRSAKLCCPLANVVKQNPVMIDACCTHFNFVNFWITGPNLVRFLHNVEKSLSFSLLKSKLLSCDSFRNACMPHDGGVGQF